MKCEECKKPFIYLGSEDRKNLLEYGWNGICNECEEKLK